MKQSKSKEEYVISFSVLQLLIFSKIDVRTLPFVVIKKWKIFLIKLSSFWKKDALLILRVVATEIWTC